MHKALVAQVETAAMDPDVLRRFYALLFGWRFSPDEGEPRNLFVSTADSNGVIRAITRASDSNSGGLSGASRKFRARCQAARGKASAGST